MLSLIHRSHTRCVPTPLIQTSVIGHGAIVNHDWGASYYSFIVMSRMMTHEGGACEASSLLSYCGAAGKSYHLSQTEYERLVIHSAHFFYSTLSSIARHVLYVLPHMFCMSSLTCQTSPSIHYTSVPSKYPALPHLHKPSQLTHTRAHILLLDSISPGWI